MSKDSSTKDLFEYIRTVVQHNTPSLKDILGKYNHPKLEINELLDIIKKDENNNKILIIDARSEKEFEESPIPSAVSFPVLNNFERHNVGLIYKKYSNTSAIWLAMKYADPKAEPLAEFLKQNDAANKQVYVYCWRGGGRSGYLAKMISDLGYKPSLVTGGFRSYRRAVNEFFTAAPFPYPLIELSGLTGSGKTELLRSVTQDLPVIDLELAAHHFSSLFGNVPFDIRDYPRVKNQSAFENALYGQVVRNHKENFPFVIESESRKVGNFNIPSPLFQKMMEAPSIRIVSSFDRRISRIVKDYFEPRKKGIEAMLAILKGAEPFFKQQLSKAVYEELITLLERGDVHKFTEIMMRDYYDKRYKDKGKTPIAEVNIDNIDQAKEELISLYNKYYPK